MQIVSDLHLHGKFSRAVSKSMTLPVMAEYAKTKGIDLLTASDWTHPLWFKEIQQLLIDDNEGIYRLKNDASSISTRFLLSTEISSIYKQGERIRRIHSLVFVPNIETAEKVIGALLNRGANLSADGRPIIGLSAKALLELILTIDERCMLIPCHVWTPHFGVYGSASGFASLDEAFEELAPHVYAIETGLSSDPEMNWQVGELQHRSIVSFSDAHSPQKMGREATVFDVTELTYEHIRQAIMRPSQFSVVSSQLSDKGQSTSQLTGHQINENRILYTIEFYPEEGKYHYSGHRNCRISYGPDDIAKKGTVCPVCKKTITEGVMLRVQTLAGESYQSHVVEKQNEYEVKWFTDSKKQHPSYVKLVPLLEIVAESMASTVASQKVTAMYERLCHHFGSELTVLLKVPTDEIRAFADDKLAQSIEKVRSGNIEIVPGYDGEYGKVNIWKDGETIATTTKEKQMSIF